MRFYVRKIIGDDWLLLSSTFVHPYLQGAFTLIRVGGSQHTSGSFHYVFELCDSPDLTVPHISYLILQTLYQFQGKVFAMRTFLIIQACINLSFLTIFILVSKTLIFLWLLIFLANECYISFSISYVCVWHQDLIRHN